ncbi:MAG: hypothetical protein RL528_529 [Bacteroidota bacterium]
MEEQESKIVIKCKFSNFYQENLPTTVSILL